MQKSNYTPIYRLLHWAIAISFMLLLITIFLRLTWMNKNNVADIIQEYMKSTDQTLSQDQAVDLAKQIRRPMWIWHIYIGYVLVGLFCIRFILPFFGSMRLQNPLEKGLTLKEKFKKWTYIVFYLCVITSLVTGLFIEFGSDSLHEVMEEIHVLSIYYLIPFMLIHLAGVLIAECTDEKGIVSRIVSGGKKDDGSNE